MRRLLLSMFFFGIAAAQTTAPVRTINPELTVGASCTDTSGYVYLKKTTGQNLECKVAGGGPGRTWQVLPGSGGGGTPGGSSADVQINSSGAFGSAPGFTANTTTGQIKTKMLNTTKLARSYATGGTGATQTAPFTGWCAGIAAGTTMLFTGNDDGTVAYYDLPDAGCTLASDVTLLGDGLAIMTWGTAGSSPWGRASVNPGLKIPAGLARVTIKGLRFDAGVAMNTLMFCEGTGYTLGATACTQASDCATPADGSCAAYGLRTCAQAPSQVGCGTGGGSFIQIGTASDNTPVTDVVITGNRFGVMRYSAGSDIYTDDPTGADVDLAGSYRRVTITGNDVDAAPSNVSAPCGSNSVQHSGVGLDFSDNRVVFSQVYHDYGGVVNTDVSCLSIPTFVTTIDDLKENHNTLKNTNGGLGIFSPGNGRVLNNNNVESDMLDACVWVGLIPGASSTTNRHRNVAISGNKCSSDTTFHAAPVRKGISSPVISLGAVDVAAITGNEIYGDSDFASIRVASSTSVTVVGNSIDIDATAAGSNKGISIFGLIGGAVTGNTLRNASYCGVYVDDNSGSNTNSGLDIGPNLILDTNGTSILSYGIGTSGACSGCKFHDNLVSSVTAPTVAFMSLPTGAAQSGNTQAVTDSAFTVSGLKSTAQIQGKLTAAITSTANPYNIDPSALLAFYITNRGSSIARTVTLTAPATDGQVFVLGVDALCCTVSGGICSGGCTDGSITVADSGTTQLNGNWVPAIGDTLTLVGKGGTWYEVSRSNVSTTGGALSDGDKTDITVSASGATWTIDAAAVTYSKIQNVSATNMLLGRSSAGAGVIQEIACDSVCRGLLDDTTQSAQRATLGLVIGTDVQAFDADLSDLADGSLSGSKVGSGIDAGNITAGTLANGRTTATDANTASAIVARDASGNFSAGGITATSYSATPSATLGGCLSLYEGTDDAPSGAGSEQHIDLCVPDSGGVSGTVRFDLNASGTFKATEIGGGAVDDTEYSYLDGVTSAIQTQLTNRWTLDGTAQSLSAVKTVTPAAGNGLIIKRAGTTGTDTALELQNSSGNTKVRLAYGNGAGNHSAGFFNSTATSGTGCTGSGTPWACCSGSGTGTCTTERSYFSNTGQGFVYDGLQTAATANLLTTGINGVYYCGADWDGDGVTTNDADDISACLVAANAAAGNAEAGADHAIKVRLPEGVFDMSTTAPLAAGFCGASTGFPLKPGLEIRGVPPRFKWQDGTSAVGRGLSPDTPTDLSPNGGTWLTCGSTYTLVMFSGQKLHGLTMTDIGANHFGTFIKGGAEQIDGISFANFENITLMGVTGSTPSSAIVGFDLINSQHVYARSINGYRLDTLWKWTSWNCDWQPANSVIVDTYLINRAKTSNADPGIWILSKSSTSPASCGEANPTSINYMTWVRPQVNGQWFGYAGSSAIKLEGADTATGPFGIQFLGIDVEGDPQHAVKTVNAVHDVTFDFAGTGANNEDMCFCDAYATYNIVRSQADQLKVHTEADNNVLYGVLRKFKGLCSGGSVPGNQCDTSGDCTGGGTCNASAIPQGSWQEANSGRSLVNTDLATVSPAYSAATGAVDYPATHSTGFFQSTDTSSYPSFSDFLSDGYLNLGVTSEHANYRSFYAHPQMYGSAATASVQDFVGFWGVPQIGTTAASAGSPNVGMMAAFKANLYFNGLGSNWTVTTMCYFCADDTLADGNTSTGATVSNFFGMHLPNLHAAGSVTDALLIDAQSNSATKGNFRMAGGSWQTGHVMLGSTHFWEEAAGLLRVSGSAPGSSTAGNGLVQTTNTATAVVAKCGNVSLDPPSIATVSTGVATATVTGLAANDVCTCAARTDFNDDLIEKVCYGTSNTLNLRLYNPTGGSIDAAAQTVDYCCFAK